MSDDRFTQDPDDPTEEELLAERERRRVLDGQRRNNRPTFRDVHSSVTPEEIEGFLQNYCKQMGIPRGKRAERVRPGGAASATSIPSNPGGKSAPSEPGPKGEAIPSAEQWAKVGGQK